MSRSMRFQIVRPMRPRTYTRAEIMPIIRREIKRRLIAAGKLADPRFAPPKFLWHWWLATTPDKVGVVEANTKSEARGLIKRVLGLSRKQTIPKDINIKRVERNADQSGSPGSCEDGSVSG